MTRKECLDAAAGCVLRDRNNEYGGPEDSFGLISSLWSAYLGIAVDKVDVAMMMGMLKMARIRGNKGYADGFVDLAGYAACGAECADGKPAPKADDEPKFKSGDRVQYRVELPSVSDWLWRDATYLRPAFSWQQDGEHIVSSDDLGPVTVKDKDIRPAPKAEAESEFKPGDKVQFCDEIPSTSEPHWFDGVYVVRLSDGGHAVSFGPNGHVIHCSDKDIRPAPKAEGCEDLVYDAPQTKEELMERIKSVNPAIYGAHLE